MKVLPLAGFETRDNNRSSGGFRQGGHAYGESRMMDSGYHENGYFDGNFASFLHNRESALVDQLFNRRFSRYVNMFLHNLFLFFCLLRLFQEKKFQ